MPSRNNNKGGLHLMRFLQTNVMICSGNTQQKFLDATKKNKFTEKDVVADDLNSIASVAIQENHTDNKAGNFVLA